DESSATHIDGTKVRCMERTMADGLEERVDLVDRGVAVRALGAAAAADHSQPPSFFDQCRQLAASHRSIQSHRSMAGITAARARGSPLGRPRVLDDAKYNDIVTRRV